MKIYDDGELTEGATIRKFRKDQTEGSRKVKREVIHYNLQIIIAIGFKVNNDRAARFRKWSGKIVKDYIIQGWTMVKENLGLTYDWMKYSYEDGCWKLQKTFKKEKFLTFYKEHISQIKKMQRWYLEHIAY